MGKPMQIPRPGHPGRWGRVQLFDDLFATREVIGHADLEEGGGKAVGEVEVIAGAADVGGAGFSAREPVLIFHSGANADAIGNGEVRAATEGYEVIAYGGAQLVEVRGKIERTAACGDLEVGAPTTVVSVVTDPIFKSPLFGGGVLENADGIEGQFGTPVGGDVYIPEDSIAYGVLRSVVGDCVGKQAASLDINPAGGTGYSLSESKRGASSQHSQNENSSFQWMASIGRGMGSGSTSV